VKRREFIGGLGGAAAWPFALRAQQVDRLRRVGVFINPVADDPVTQARLAAFVAGLQQLGWTDSSTTYPTNLQTQSKVLVYYDLYRRSHVW
jgi:putative ABC transport system substrate-binding protein